MLLAFPMITTMARWYQVIERDSQRGIYAFRIEVVKFWTCVRVTFLIWFQREGILPVAIGTGTDIQIVKYLVLHFDLHQLVQFFEGVLQCIIYILIKTGTLSVVLTSLNLCLYFLKVLSDK